MEFSRSRIFIDVVEWEKKDDTKKKYRHCIVVVVMLQIL